MMNSAKIDKNKKTGHIYLFLTAVLVMLIVILLKELYIENKMIALKRYMTDYYYSQSNLDAAMRNALGDVYDEGSYENFDNYVYKLVLDDINKYESEKTGEYNRIFSKADSERVSGIIEEPGEINVRETEKGICCITINDFTDGYTYKAIKEHSDVLQNADKLIIDLRNNTGGSVKELSKVLSLFYDKGEIVLADVSDNDVNEYRTKDDRIIDFKRLVFLCNGKTASSAEAMIFCMQSDFGNKIAVVGEKTYGKNFSYAYKKFDDGHVMIFVSSLMCNSDKESFDPDGIIPDYEKNDDECYDFALNLLME